MTRYFILPLLISFLIGCSVKPKENTEMRSTIIAEVEPFCIEHYKFIIAEDTSLVLYFNRDIKKSEEAEIRVDLFMPDSVFAFGVLPFDNDTKDNKLKIKLPVTHSVYSKHFPDVAPGGKFMNWLPKVLEGEFERIEFRMGTSDVPSVSRFTPNEYLYTIYDALEFKETDIQIGRKYDRFKSTTPWWTTVWKYYEGHTDTLGQKQGEWIWQFANGHTKATANFINDSLIDHFVFYRFDGTVQDSTHFEYKDTTKVKIKRTYNRFGKLMSEKSFESKI